MPVTKVRSQWVAGNLEFVLATDASKKVGGIPAITGTTTKAAGTLVVPITAKFVTMASGGAEALSLADGVPGQEITLLFGTDAGDATLTPSRVTGFQTIVFQDVGDTVTLRYVDDTIGWILIGYMGLAAPPTLT